MRDLSGATLAILSALIVVGCGRASPTAAPAAPTTRAQDVRTTGEAFPTRSGPGDGGRYGRLAVRGSTGAQVVTLDGEPVLTVASVEADGLSVDRVVAIGAHDLAMVEVDGAVACPVRYVVLDTGPSRATRASAPFGTCAVGPRIHVDGANLVIDLPGWHGSGEPAPAARYIYADGAVKLLWRLALPRPRLIPRMVRRPSARR